MRAPALMINPIQHYAWGSHTAIAELQRREPSRKPEAELWMGAHHAAPSRVVLDGQEHSLLDCIEKAPEDVLGSEVIERFGPRLPFLLKVLAADTPLSLQAHPTEAQAEQGFHAEEARGIPIDAPERNYRDRSAKPELLCALSPVDALCGFRDPLVTADLLDRLSVEALKPIAHSLREDPPEACLPLVMERILTWPLHERRDLVSSVVDAAQRLAAQGHEYQAEAQWTVRLGELYPEDPGVIAALLLNLLRLKPGQAIYLPSGNLHAYLGGFGVEVMANSDNVLRGGLTPKHVDVPELQRVLDHSAGPASAVLPEDLSDHQVAYPTPAPNFQLSRVEVTDGSGVALENAGPRVLLCVHGAVTVDGSDGSTRFGQGESVFVPAATDFPELSGAGVVFHAAVPSAAVTA